MGEVEELKSRLNILVDKEGRNADRELTLEMILQLAELNANFKRGIVVFEGGEAEDVEEEGESNEFP